MTIAVSIVLMGLIVALLAAGRVTPMPVFIGLPVLAALFLGYSPGEIGGFMETGIGQVAQVAALFIFAILYFGVMSDRGLFDPLVNALIRASGGRPVTISVATFAMALLCQLDGSGATTFAISIPALLPLYDSLRMRRVLLLCLVGLGAGVMNVVPWGGSTLRAATVINEDPTDLWASLAPAQAFGIVCGIVVAALLGLRETRRIADLDAESGSRSGVSAGRVESVPPAASATTTPTAIRIGRFRYLINLALTLVAVAVLVSGIVPSAAVFMVAFSLALVLNVADVPGQQDLIARHAPAALFMAATIMSAGVLLGILSGTGMMLELAEGLATIAPDAVGSYIHVTIGIIAVPLHLVLGTDTYYFGLMPVVVDLAATFGVSEAATARALLIGENLGFALSPLVPSVWIAIGLSKVSIGEHIRYSLPIYWFVSLLMLGFAIATGLVL